MLRIAICGRALDQLREMLAKFPVRIVDRKPDVVISYGGVEWKAAEITVE